MIKLQEFGQALGRNKYLSALQAAMMSCMGVIMVGAIFQIICSVCSTMFGLFTADSQIYQILYTPYNFTMNMLSLWVVAFMSYNYARNLEMDRPLVSTIEALASFLLVCGALSVNEAGATVMDITYLGATGMFVGFLVVFVVVNVDKICHDKKIYIRMPDIVPQFLQDGFAGIVPMFFNVIIFLGVDTAISMATGGTLGVASGLIAALSVPLAGLTSVPGMFIMCLFAGLLWCFGIHGTMVLVGIIMPLSIQALTANGEAVAAGAAPQFYPVFLFAAMAACGGTGNTFPVALFGLKFAKSEQIKAVAKAAIIPGWFNINEPITFGMPVMYNPIMCIPYILAIPVNMAFYLIGYMTGLLMPGWIVMSALLPMGFGAYLTSLNPMNAVWDYLSIIPMSIIWFPFLKAYDKQLCEKEAEALAAESAE